MAANREVRETRLAGKCLDHRTKWRDTCGPLSEQYAYPRSVPAAASTHPPPGWMAANTEDIELGDGTRIRLRPILAEDKQRLTDSMKRMSPESRYLRFLHMIDRLSDAELRYLTEIDYGDHFAWVALSLDEPDEPLIGVARYIRDPTETTRAEAAVAVIDDYQGRGLGTILLTRLAATAKRNGVRSFTAYVSPINRRILEMVQAVEATIIPENGILRFEAPLGVDTAGEANRELLRAAAAGDAEIRSPAPPAKSGRHRFNRRRVRRWWRTGSRPRSTRRRWQVAPGRPSTPTRRGRDT